MIVPFYQDEAVCVYCADYRDVVPALTKTDHVITDPPYNLRAEDITIEARTFRRDFGAWDEDWDPVPFLAMVADRVRAGGTLLAFTSDRVISRYRTAPGWKPRGTIVWLKSNPTPVPRPQYVQATEFIVWLQREGGPAVWNGTGYTPNVLTYPFCTGHAREDHPTQKPEALMRDLILRHTNPGEALIDPFMGSGTTLVAAKRLGRKAVGIERDPRYCAMAVERLRQGALDLEGVG